MHKHTELFSNVSGLGLIHCGLGLEKIAGVVICRERGAHLDMAQLMPLPLIVSCFSKIQTGPTFLVPAHPGSPGQRAAKRVCVCVLAISNR